ncbi:IS66 family transposase [Brenneria uluponensis]|uniref:IS66 family transposase n=1 Tax=Brenneria uluponensis TaxID=3057057 RepID=UPI0028EF3A4D|nr:IS66 family transposase [Brenneria ulupoensis]
MNIDALLTSKDPDELRALALKLLADLEQQTQRNQTQTCYIQQLEEALKNARQWRFGRKSEAFQGEQRGLFDEDIEADAADIEQQLATLLPEPEADKPAVPKRRPLPPELPRQDIHLAPASDSCPDCGHALRFIRDEISERLEYVPARFIVHRHIRPQFSCEHCDTVVSAPLPAQLIEKGQPGPGLLAQVVSAKCLDHLPLYRQQVIYQRSGVDIPRSTLAGWSGTLVVDGYAGYQALFDSGQALDAGCWAHARRKFFELFTINKSPVAKLALDSIRELYQLERKIKQRPADKKRQWRQRYAKPRLEVFHQWLVLQQPQAAPNSALRKALDYILKRWPALLHYLDDGRVPIDNNRCENVIRPVALGRKNWMFAGSLRAGQRMAAILSLLETAKLNGHDPYIWLRDVLARLPTWPNNRLNALLPYAENSFS